MPRLRRRDPRRAGLLLLGAGVGTIVLMIVYGPAVNAQQAYTLPVPPVLVVGWGLAFFCIALSQAIQPVTALVNPVTTFLGRISYSLYLVHPLVIYSTGLTVWIAAQVTPTPLALALVFAAVFTVTIPVAWVLYTVVEAPFIALGRRLTQAPRDPLRAAEPAA